VFFLEKGGVFLKTVGIICEYNPMHLGHKKQIDEIRRICGEDTAVVCLMSGNFVQRGAPAIIDKTLRAKVAVQCGADLVLELPVEYALSSAEGFASGGVSILGKFCDALCFGAETADTQRLLDIAGALLSEEFKPLLKAELSTGKSFPAARQAALSQMEMDASMLETPNNILAVEYCKAILSQNCSMEPLPIHRGGSYHEESPDPVNPSATAVRQLMLRAQDWNAYIPEAAQSIFAAAPLHTLKAGERAILGKLRTMTDSQMNGYVWDYSTYPACSGIPETDQPEGA
jgi:predicted nucleotidyltransferase